MTPRTLDHHAIAALIPHGPSMCLLHRITAWDEQTIYGESVFDETLFSPDAPHPLADQNGLSSWCLIEYGAQAAAVHAGLLHSGLGAARPAYIGAVKSVSITQPYVIPRTPIKIVATCLMNSANGAIYEISATQSAKVILHGRSILNQPA